MEVLKKMWENKMTRMYLLVAGGLILLFLIVIIIASGGGSKVVTEKTLTNAAASYISNNPSLAPRNDYDSKKEAQAAKADIKGYINSFLTRFITYFITIYINHMRYGHNTLGSVWKTTVIVTIITIILFFKSNKMGNTVNLG